MKKHIVPSHLLKLFTLGLMGASSYTWACGFQLWEQDGASVGNYHAGRAAEAADASINYYNPAGTVLIPNKQLVLGVDPVITHFKYDGTVQVNTLGPFAFPVDGVQGGTFAMLPNAHFVVPLTQNLTFGVSLVSPFGLKTDYGHDTFLQYAGTLTSLKVADLAPALAVAINPALSFGAGLDIEYAKGEFDLTGVVLNPITNTSSKNIASDYAYGFHAGALYQWSPMTRVGLSYHSKVTHHLHGDSSFTGPLANNFIGGTQKSDHFKAGIVLPATTTLSIFHKFNPKLDLMGTVIYTQWGTFNQVIFENVAGIQFLRSSNDITVVIPEGYSNTWNYSIGGNYHFNRQWMLRLGVGYDQTPSNDHDRNIQLPDQSRYVGAIGGHFQATKRLGFDLGWSHYFIVAHADIHVSQPVGDQVTTTDGNSKDGADVFGLQVKWDIV